MDMWTTSVSWWTAEKPATSFGIDVCLRGATATTITSVDALRSIGQVEILEPLVMTSTSPGGAIIYTDSYPPELADGSTVALAEGATFTYQSGSTVPFQQVLVGFRATSTDGGGWDGVVISYDVEGQQYELTVPTRVFMCGDETEACREPDASSPSVLR